MQNLKIQAPERSKGISRAFTQVTPDVLRRAMGAARAGEPGMLFGVLDFFLSQDDEIPSALESLVSVCVQDGVEVVPLDESDEAARQAEEAQAVINDLNVVALMEELLLAHYYGVSAAVPVWDAYERRNACSRCRPARAAAERVDLRQACCGEKEMMLDVGRVGGRPATRCGAACC